MRARRRLAGRRVEEVAVNAPERPILLVEDNPDHALLTARALTKNHIRNRIDVVADGEAALAYLREATGVSDSQSVPVVVLLDLKLPKVDGLEVLERMRAEPHLGRLPVVILTSSDEESDIVRSYDLGVNSYVRKPVDFQAFTNAVGQLGLYWVLLNEFPPEL